MIIHFGSNFGFENVYPRLVNKVKSTTHGQIQLGQKGLLEFLELHLGLKQQDVADVLRISAYKKGIALAIEESPNLYFTNSFKLDSWGTTKVLLTWRDELQLGNWNFVCDDVKKERLYALSKIENSLEEMPSGVNDRWRAILGRIIEWPGQLPLDKVFIYEDPEFIHPFFKNLFSRLEKRNVTLEWEHENSMFEESNLGIFKAQLFKQHPLNRDSSKIKKLPLLKDDSICIIKADSEKLIADALSSYLTNNKELDPLFVIPDRGEILEQSLIKRGFASMGYTASLEDGAFDQLFHLLPIFLWEPIDPEKLIQYLVLPNAPINKELRFSLAEAFAEKAGIGNDVWQESILKHCKKFDKDLEKTQAKLSKWFDRKKFKVQNGADRDAISDLYQALKKWAISYAQLLDEEDSRLDALKKLSRQCQGLLDLIALEIEEDQKVKPISLNKWLKNLRQASSSKMNSVQKNAFEHVISPANITEKKDVIIWWNFLEGQNPLNGVANWTENELYYLKDVYLHSNSLRIDQWYNHLANGVMKCKKQLILCIPNKRKGESVDVNPLYYDLSACFGSLIEISSEIDLNHSTISIANDELKLQQMEEKELPKLTLTWDIGEQVFEKRKQESYSSLNKLFYYPYEYLMSYLLNIRPFNIPDVSINSLLKGNIAHNTAEKIWKEKDLFDKEKIDLEKFIRKTLDHVLQREGAVFQLAKNKISLVEFKTMTIDSLCTLIALIKRNGWRFYEAEESYAKEDEITLNGRIDLVLKRGEDEYAIIDLKWGGFTSKKDEFKKEKELQLIIYDRLLKDKKKVHLLYYIISSKKFLSRSNLAIKEAVVINYTDKKEEKLREEIWSKMSKTYNARLKQLAIGKIEVGDGLLIDDISEEFEMWKDEESFLSPLRSRNKKIKRTNKYSPYGNIIGRES